MGKKRIVGVSYKNYINNQSEMNVILEEINKIDTNGIHLFICPSIGLMQSTANTLTNKSIMLGAQNISPYVNGPYTGEYSLESLIDLQGSIVEIGHYERMTIFKENKEDIKRKIDLCLNNQVIPLICLGEEVKQSIEERKITFENYLKFYLKDYKENEIIIAYEPWWAIGQPQAADASYVEESHRIIKEILEDQLKIDNFRIIYGGSVSAINAPELISKDNVDGVFVGRFGHDVENLKEIIKIVKGEI